MKASRQSPLSSLFHTFEMINTDKLLLGLNSFTSLCDNSVHSVWSQEETRNLWESDLTQMLGAQRGDFIRRQERGRNGLGGEKGAANHKWRTLILHLHKSGTSPLLNHMTCLTGTGPCKRRSENVAKPTAAFQAAAEASMIIMWHQLLLLWHEQGNQKKNQREKNPLQQPEKQDGCAMTIKTILFNTILKEGWNFRGRAEKLDKLISPFAHTFLIISIISSNPAEDWGGEISHLDPALLYAGKHHVNKLCFYLLCCRKLTRRLRSSISYPDSPFLCSWRDGPSLFKKTKQKKKHPAAIWCRFTKQLQLELTCKMQDKF